MQLYMPYVIAY